MHLSPTFFSVPFLDVGRAVRWAPLRQLEVPLAPCHLKPPLTVEVGDRVHRRSKWRSLDFASMDVVSKQTSSLHSLMFRCDKGPANMDLPGWLICHQFSSVVSGCRSTVKCHAYFAMQPTSSSCKNSSRQLPGAQQESTSCVYKYTYKATSTHRRLSEACASQCATDMYRRVLPRQHVAKTVYPALELHP
jgi:hypothetical protein